MKPSVFATLLAAALFSSCETDDILPRDVPVAARQTLLNAFPNAQNIVWERNSGKYEAEFDLAAVKYNALLTPEGSLLMYKHDIATASLTAEVKTTISQKYKSYWVDDAEQLVKGTQTFYQVELDNNTHEQKRVFSPDGKEQTQQAYWD